MDILKTLKLMDLFLVCFSLQCPSGEITSEVVLLVLITIYLICYSAFFGPTVGASAVAVIGFGWSTTIIAGIHLALVSG